LYAGTAPRDWSDSDDKFAMTESKLDGVLLHVRLRRQ